MKNNKQITGSKIVEHLINIVVLDYIKKVLKPFPNIEHIDLILDIDEENDKYNIKYNRRQREKQYDNITLLIYINNTNNISNIKEQFLNYLNNKLTNKSNILKDGTISSLYPIYGKYKSNNKLVQINHIIVNDKNEYEFRKNYSNMSKERQLLYTNIIDKCTDILVGKTKSIFKYKLLPDSISYYIIKPNIDKSNIDKQCIWKSNDWNKVLDLLDETLGEDYDIDNMSLDEIIHHMERCKFIQR